jgi:hypothetical protein
VVDTIEHYRGQARYMLEFSETVARAAVRAARESDGRDAESAERYMAAALDAAARQVIEGSSR